MAQAYCAWGRPGVSGGLAPTESPSEGWQWRLLVWLFGAERSGEPN